MEVIYPSYRITKLVAYKICNVATLANRFKTPEENESVSSKRVDVFCVNLKTASKRREHMIKQFKKAEIPDAKFTLAATISDEDMKELVKEGKYASQASIRNVYRDLLRAEIGCYSSHMLIWREIIERNLSAALVCEDDIEFKIKYRDILDLMRYLPKDADICHLDLRKNPRRIINKKFCKFYKDRIFGTSCYLITQNGANKLWANSRIFDMPLDHKILAMHRAGKLNVYGSNKKCAIHLGEKEGELSSSIR